MTYPTLKQLLEAPMSPDGDTLESAVESIKQSMGDLLDFHDADLDEKGYVSVSAGYAGGTGDISARDGKVSVSYVMTEDQCKTYADDTGHKVADFKKEVVDEFKSAAESAGFQLLGLDTENGLHLSAAWGSKAAPSQSATPSAKYDPQQAYFDRMTPASRSMYSARKNHQFADDIGGSSSNYRF